LYSRNQIDLDTTSDKKKHPHNIIFFRPWSTTYHTNGTAIMLPLLYSCYKLQCILVDRPADLGIWTYIFWNKLHIMGISIILKSQRW